MMATPGDVLWAGEHEKYSTIPGHDVPPCRFPPLRTRGEDGCATWPSAILPGKDMNRD